MSSPRGILFKGFYNKKNTDDEDKQQLHSKSKSEEDKLKKYSNLKTAGIIYKGNQSPTDESNLDITIYESNDNIERKKDQPTARNFMFWTPKNSTLAHFRTTQ